MKYAKNKYLYERADKLTNAETSKNQSKPNESKTILQFENAGTE